MSDYYNEAGEPLMSGEAMRYEMYLDSTYEPDPDDYYDAWDEEPEPQDPATCEHGNGSFPEGAGFDCDDCDSLLLGPRTEPYVTSEWDNSGDMFTK